MFYTRHVLFDKETESQTGEVACPCPPSRVGGDLSLESSPLLAGSLLSYSARFRVELQHFPELSTYY